MQIKITKPTKTTFHISASCNTADAMKLQKFLQYIADNLSASEISKTVGKLNFPFADAVALKNLKEFINK